MVEAVEFPHLANKYEVFGVPRSIFNEEVHQEGAAPEPLMVARVLQSVGMLSEEEVEAMFPSSGPAEDHIHHDEADDRAH